MKIKQTKTGFRRIIDIGVYSFFIEVDVNGAYIKNEDIIESAQHFKNITFMGPDKGMHPKDGDVFDFKDDIEKIVKKLKKLNPFCNITFYTKGTIKPVGLGKYDNINYNVFLELKASGIHSDDRLKESPIKFFKDSNARFIFWIHGEDEVDEVNMIVTSNELKKEQIYLIPKANENDVIKLCKIYGYNLCYFVDENFFEVKEHE